MDLSLFITLFFSLFLVSHQLRVNSTLPHQPLWSADFSMKNDSCLCVHVTVPLNSYIGLGFGSSMFNSDMIVATVTSDKVRVFDMWSEDYEVPSDAEDQNVEVEGIVLNQTHAKFRMLRNLTTNDRERDYQIAKGVSVPMMWAFVPRASGIVSHSVTQRGFFRIVIEDKEDAEAV